MFGRHEEIREYSQYEMARGCIAGRHPVNRERAAHVVLACPRRFNAVCMQILASEDSSYAHDHLVGSIRVDVDGTDPPTTMLAIVTVERVARCGSDGRVQQLVSLHDAAQAAVRAGTVLIVAYKSGGVKEMELHSKKAADSVVVLVQEALVL